MAESKEPEYRTPKFGEPDPSGADDAREHFNTHWDKIGQAVEHLPGYKGDPLHPYPSHTFTHQGKQHRVSMDQDDWSGSGVWPPEWHHYSEDDDEVAKGQGWKSFHQHIKKFLGK
jgi:hypothetical protein